MVVTLDGRELHVRFHHEPVWTPGPDGILYIPKHGGRVAKRHVHGRTQCVVTDVRRDPACQIHGASPERLVRNADGLIVSATCTCVKTPVVDGWAYCSVRDNYNARDGRKFALRAAIKVFSRIERGLFWKEFLLHSSQRVMVHAHEERRRVLTA